MTNETCAVAGCRKPPIQGSQYCEYHLAARTQKASKVGSILLAVLAVAGLVVKFIKGHKG